MAKETEKKDGQTLVGKIDGGLREEPVVTQSVQNLQDYVNGYFGKEILKNCSKRGENNKMADKLPAHLEKRLQDISEKAKVETANLDSYKALEDGYEKLSKQCSEAIERVVVEAFMDHFKKNDFKSEGFGTSFCRAVNAYFKLLDYVPEDKGPVKAILNFASSK